MFENYFPLPWSAWTLNKFYMPSYSQSQIASDAPGNTIEIAMKGCYFPFTEYVRV